MKKTMIIIGIVTLSIIQGLWGLKDNRVFSLEKEEQMPSHPEPEARRFIEYMIQLIAEIDDESKAKVFLSAEGIKHGVPPIPLVIYGHLTETIAKRVSTDTTINCIAIVGIDTLEHVVSHLDCLGIRAQSRIEHSGEAKQAIETFRKHTRQRGLLLYGAWHYNTHLAAQQAIECGADGIEMPGTLTSELYAYILGVLGEVQNGSPVPTTVEEHTERIKRYITTKSAFWEMQDWDVPGRKIF